MKMGFFRYALPALVALPATILAGNEIVAEVSVADAEVRPQASDKQVLVPADLEYAIELETNCEPGSEPASLSLGVADTRHRFDLTDFAASGRVSSTFVVPGEQLAPVVTKGYCIADNPASQTAILLPAVFTAQISLVCSSGNSDSVHYLSQPLAVRLLCVSADKDQEASSDTAR